MSKRENQGFSATDWIEIQKKYLEACRSFAEVMAGNTMKPVAPPDPVRDAAEFWWKSVSPFLPQDQFGVLGKALPQGQLFTMLGSEMYKFLHDLKPADKRGTGWEALLRQHFENLKSVFSEHAQLHHALPEMMGAWQLLPMDTLQRMLSLTSVMPGDYLADLKRDTRQVTDKFLSMPGVGYTRESQEQFQESLRLWNSYQEVGNEFNQAMGKVTLQAVDAMRDKILALAREGKQLQSLREIYDLWIDCNEETYAAYVYTPEFSELYGRLTNALMALKQHGRNIVDEYLGALNVPTHKGINTLQKRQYELLREQKTAQKKIQLLENEVAALRAGARRQQAEQVKKTKTVPRSRPGGRRKQSAARPAAAVRSKPAARRAPKKKSGTAAKDKMIVIKI